MIRSSRRMDSYSLLDIYNPFEKIKEYLGVKANIETVNCIKRTAERWL